MKRSRRVILTMMGTAAIGAVSMGFVRRGDHCGPGFVLQPVLGPDGRVVDTCRVTTYGGFGGGPRGFHGHGHGHGG
jgi:hypothetical protein